MLGFINYNFLQDGDALNPYPTHIEDINKVKIQNAIYNDFLISSDVNSNYSVTPPTAWDIYTILWATFNNTINAGSVDLDVGDIVAIRIKRRKLGEFDWFTIYEKEINDVNDFAFSGNDYFAQYGEEYEYAWVPVLQTDTQGELEGNYITNSIESKFNGVFVCDADTIHKLYAGVAYGTSQQTQQVGIYNPIGKKYPIYVTNGANNYQTGSVTSKIVGNYENTGVFDRKEMVQEKNNLIKWLTNKKAKIIKDYNGNIWLVFITGAPSVSYDSQWGNGMMEMSFQWGEIGDPNDVKDMQNVGLWPQSQL